jgi:hypothetical protein
MNVHARVCAALDNFLEQADASSAFSVAGRLVDGYGNGAADATTELLYDLIVLPTESARSAQAIEMAATARVIEMAATLAGGDPTDAPGLTSLCMYALCRYLLDLPMEARRARGQDVLAGLQGLLWTPSALTKLQYLWDTLQPLIDDEALEGADGFAAAAALFLVGASEEAQVGALSGWLQAFSRRTRARRLTQSEAMTLQDVVNGLWNSDIANDLNEDLQTSGLL